MKPLFDIAPGETQIDSNGGGLPEPIEALFTALKAHTLCPTFEKYGNFVEVDPVNDADRAIYPAGTTSFFGNFADLSHVFSIATRDADLAGRLTAAIRDNQALPRYAKAKADEEERLRWWAAHEAKRLREAQDAHAMRAGRFRQAAE